VARALAQGTREAPPPRPDRQAPRPQAGDRPGHRRDVAVELLGDHADNFTFGPNSQAEAVNKIGVAIKPTLDLFNLAKKNGVAVFLITGRREAVRQPRTENLQEQGFTGWAGLILKPDASTQTTVAYKSGARATIEQQGYRIVANVGEQYSDLAGGHEDKAFKLPNPFYFLP
jgi:hypothetical protein